MFVRCALIGLSGSGKSTVAPLLAARLGWRAVDLDREIVRRTGRSVAELFQRDSETTFRAMERELTSELSSEGDVVLATGGGWAAQPGNLELLGPDSAVVWLRVAPKEAFRRLRGSPEVRPLLEGPDPLATLEELDRRRREHYERADLTIDVDGNDPAAVAQQIDEWLRRST